MIKDRIGAIYARVSTEEQNTDIQIQEIKKMFFQQNITIFDIYIDKVSGSKDSRPDLNRLMFDMRKGSFNCVGIYKLDRLGRSLKNLITICEEFNNKNIDLIVTSQGIDTKTAHGKLLFNILGSVAEFERELISERTKLGQKKNRDKVGKRGKDKKKRRKSGYYRRWENHNKKMGV